MVTIDWPTKTINVPKSYLTAGTGPASFYLDINDLHLKLRELEEDALAFPDTHRHNTTVFIAGTTIARVMEIINGYTITFEDGAYSVNIIGGNSNVGDVANFNTVRINSGNTAGLQVVEVPVLQQDERDAIIRSDDTTQVLKKLELARTRIDKVRNVLEIYDEDGTTILYEFDLFDRNGAGSIEEIFERRLK